MFFNLFRKKTATYGISYVMCDTNGVEVSKGFVIHVFSIPVDWKGFVDTAEQNLRNSLGKQDCKLLIKNISKL